MVKRLIRFNFWLDAVQNARIGHTSVFNRRTSENSQKDDEAIHRRQTIELSRAA